MKHSLVRNSIIDTASELFYQKGYNLTGINEIIKEAGIAKATLYNHFKSKDDICVAYLKSINGVFLEDIREYALKRPKGKKQLLALFDFLEAFFLTKEFNGCWCINTISEIPRDNEIIRNEIQNQKSKFLELITFLMENSFPNKINKESKMIAKQIYLMYESGVSESHLHQEMWPIKAARQFCDKILS